MAIEFDHVSKGVIEPIADHIIVTDIESETEVRTASGLILPSEAGNDRGIRPRWAQVYAVGPDQIDIQSNQWILIDHGRWTRGVKLDDNKVYRRVDPKDVLMVSDEKPAN